MFLFNFFIRLKQKCNFSNLQRSRAPKEQVIEQLGTWDPLTNAQNESLIALNIERINHWIGAGSHLSTPAAELLGIAGLLPVHPRTYLKNLRQSKNLAE